MQHSWRCCHRYDFPGKSEILRKGYKGKESPTVLGWVSGYNSGEGIVALGFHSCPVESPLRNHCTSLFLRFSLYVVLIIIFFF